MKNNHFYFIGIKGYGMSALALLLHKYGYDVSGSDQEKELVTQHQLLARNIAIYPFNEDHIEDGMHVIVGNSFDHNFPEVAKALANPNVKVSYYYEFLASLINDYYSICVSGTHGKTTTTSMLASILPNTGYLIGDGNGSLIKENEYFVAESCEYKDVFLNYHPNIACITTLELDHVDYFPTFEDYLQSFQQFTKQAKDALILNGDDINIAQLRQGKKGLNFGFQKHNDVYPVDIVVEDGKTFFSISYKGEIISGFESIYVGNHFLLDALAAISCALYLDVPISIIKEGLKNFKGARRRFSCEYQKDYVYVDDYAHHPSEIKATLLAAKQKFKDKEIAAIYKPDRGSRMEYFLDDFADAFQYANYTYVAELYGIEHADAQVRASDLLAKIDNSSFISEDINGAKQLAKHHNCAYVFVSSKDIYKLKDLLKEIQGGENDN